MPVKAIFGLFFDFFHGQKIVFTPTFFTFFTATLPISRALFLKFSRVGNFQFQGLKSDFYSFARENFQKFTFFENFHGQILFFTATFFAFFTGIFIFHGHFLENFHGRDFFFHGEKRKRCFYLYRNLS